MSCSKLKVIIHFLKLLLACFCQDRSENHQNLRATEPPSLESAFGIMMLYLPLINHCLPPFARKQNCSLAILSFSQQII